MNSQILLYPIFLPIVAGALFFLLPKSRRFLTGAILSTFVTGATLVFSILIFVAARTHPLLFETSWLGVAGIDLRFLVRPFNSFILLSCAAFGFLISLYSISYMSGKPRLKEYYAYLLFTVGAAAGACLADNFIVLLFFWELLVLMLYGLVGIYGREALQAAKKSFVIVAGADFAMLLGIGLLFSVSGTFNMSELAGTKLADGVTVAAFIFLCVGALTKAGAMPFHTWIPAASLAAPMSVMAFVPAALDKLLGIYLLGRIAFDIFDISSNQSMMIVLMSIGGITVLAAVIMAMLQKDLRRLLSFHAISQVGYMVLGIGTGVPLGIAGGLFHMINHAIYKSCLFLGGGAVEHRAKETKLEKLGGLSSVMPITFITFVVAAMAISGLPPLNGFFSKWMVYQGIIETGKTGIGFYPIFLIAAMFGSVLTLASFLKLIHSIFLGNRPDDLKKTEIKEVGFSMSFPLIVLASACVIFGVFANSLPLKHLILPSLPTPISSIGLWTPGLATLLIIVGVVIGFVIYLIGRVKPTVSSTFIGGEVLEPEETRIPGTHFYGSSVKSIDVLNKTYEAGEAGAFDVFVQGMALFKELGKSFSNWIDRSIDRFYDVLANLVSVVGKGLSALHIGDLPVYLIWILSGMLIITFILLFGH